MLGTAILTTNGIKVYEDPS